MISREPAVIQGCRSRASDPAAIRNGTTQLNTPAGVNNSRTEPAALAMAATGIQRRSHGPRSRSSGREAAADPGQQATIATVLAMVA